MENLTSKYNFKVCLDQFGNSVPEDFYDQSEILAIQSLESIALGLKAGDKKELVMLELGAGHAYYSLLFKNIVGYGRSRNYLVEPYDEYMLRGKRQFELNNALGTWIDKSIGNSWVLKDNLQFNKESFRISDIITEYEESSIDLLHCDIDGSEMAALTESELLFSSHVVKNAIISTHSDELYSQVHEFMVSRGYKAIVEHPTMDVGYDGLLVFTYQEQKSEKYPQFPFNAGDTFWIEIQATEDGSVETDEALARLIWSGNKIGKFEVTNLVVNKTYFTRSVAEELINQIKKHAGIEC
jgi:hypothetical protein